MRVPFSPETIGRHERGEVPVGPDDVIQYAKGYGRPDIIPLYCADCPIGRCTGRTATERPLPLATLRLNHMINEAKSVADRLEEIAYDGIIEENEKEDFNRAIRYLHELESTISDMILLGMRMQGTKKAAPAVTGSGAVKKALIR